MKLFKTYSEKEVKRVMPIVNKINSLEPEMEKLTDHELKEKTEYFKKQLSEGKKLDDILPEAFAVVREASKRALGMRHFDVQLIGGIILHQGRIAEMKTGEGKTLVATLPVYLNALEGKGVHVITVNDYLAKRDSEWMGKLYKFLGLSVGLVIAGMDPQAKQKAYAADIIISVRDLCKCFGDFIAVDHITFDVKRGEIFGFLGANGAGKTTAMRMLCGLSYPTSGRGMVAGYDVMTQGEEIKKHIGYMSQKFSLYDDLTVRENIRLYAGIYGLSRYQMLRRTVEMLNRLHFRSEIDTLVGSLPLGWKQKLAFSIATLHRPEVVFLDEPTGGVDPVTRRQFWEMIYEAASGGTTVFVTTHYMDEAEYCSRVSIMVDGKVKALGSPAELKKQYAVGSMDEVFRILARSAKRGE